MVPAGSGGDGEVSRRRLAITTDFVSSIGATRRIRTDDLLITNQFLGPTTTYLHPP